MVTKLQRLVEIVEDRHVGEYHNRTHQVRGSVLNATPSELDAIRKISVPMDKDDHGAHRAANRSYGNISGWKKWLNAKN